jgi:hypothetical protein
MSSPSFDSLIAPQQVRRSRGARAGRCSGNGLWDGRLRWTDVKVCVRAAARSDASSSDIETMKKISSLGVS